MENLEEDLNEIINANTADATVDVLGAVDSGPPNQPDNSNDSVEIIETPIEVLDLTSPQPSTSSSNSAGAVGPSSLVKRNLEETLKETNADQNPSTSSSANTTGSSTSSGGTVLECPICLQTCIHPARLPCGHIFCFLCVKGVAYKNRRCAMCRREIPPEFLDHPQLVNGIQDICTTKATDDGYQWFYEGRNGGWWEYEKRNESEIEAAFQNFNNTFSYNQLIFNAMKKALNLKKENDDDDSDNDDDNEGESSDNHSTYNMQICGNTYVVDFLNMVQYPQNMPYRKRKICRAKGLPSKGVAGILAPKGKHRMRPY